MLVKTKLEQGDKAVLSGVSGGVITDAIELVRLQNSESVADPDKTEPMLKTKIIAKLPEVQASVAEAAAKVEVAAR